ncbi:MAG: GAF domain-containing protein [Planctomycetota bacterium]
MTRTGVYDEMAGRLAELLGDETDFVANAANTAAVVYGLLADVSWVGIYVNRDGELVLGPFQGPPACTRIGFGEGVCGTAAAERRTVVVPDVRRFPGHIACQADARSEIVVPIKVDGRIVGVLDVDSPVADRFGADDEEGLERLVAVFLRNTSMAL